MLNLNLINTGLILSNACNCMHSSMHSLCVYCDLHALSFLKTLIRHLKVTIFCRTCCSPNEIFTSDGRCQHDPNSQKLILDGVANNGSVLHLDRMQGSERRCPKVSHIDSLNHLIDDTAQGCFLK